MTVSSVIEGVLRSFLVRFIVIVLITALVCGFLLADEVALEMAKCGESQNARAPTVQIRTTSTQPEELKTVPDVRYSSFVKLTFGETVLCGMFVLDGAGRYRSLYFDTNGNADLTDEEEIRGKILEIDGKVTKIFELKELNVKFGKEEVKGIGLVFLTSGDSINVTVKANWCWQGKIPFDDGEYKVLIFDSNLNGSLSDESSAWVDFDDDESFGMAEMLPLDVPFLYGEKSYLFKVGNGKGGGQVLNFTTEKIVGCEKIKSPYSGLLSIIKEDGVVYARSLKGEFYLSKGKHKVGNVVFSKRAEDGAIWDMTYKFNREIDTEKTKEIPTPEPLVFKLSVGGSGGDFSFSLQTSQGVGMVTLFRNGERLGYPTVAIRDENGKVHHRFEFTPG